MNSSPPKQESEKNSEARLVVAKRLAEARGAGLTNVEARLFAYGGRDVGELRKLVEKGASPALIARILI